MVHFVTLPAPDKRFLKSPPGDATVLIVGGGPAGLFAGLLLAKRNIRSVIVEKYPIRTGQPKAHAINPRSLEIFRQAGLDTSALRKLGSTVEDAGYVSFVTVVTGTEIGSILYERQDEEVKELTPEPLFNIPQPTFETFLQEAALETGLVTIHRQWEWQKVEFGSGGRPKSILKKLGDDEVKEITSEYLIGADGTESSVRKSLKEVTFDGLPGHSAARRHYVSIHASGNLRPTIKELGHHSAVLYFCMHPRHRNALIVYDIESSWVYARVINPVAEPAESFTMERCRELLNGCLGTDKIPYHVVSVNLWHTDPRIASSYSDPTLRAFLAGDSAHTFPPTGGLGINTGIADVHNLCWKIAEVLSDGAKQPDRLLQSYTLERRPVAIANALQSFQNQYRQNEELEPAVKNSLGDASIDDDEGIEKQFQQPAVKFIVQEAISKNKPHFDSLGLQLGYVYGQGDPTIPVENCALFEPSAAPGARLPHCWISKGISILDRITPDKFTLLVNSASTGEEPVSLIDGKDSNIVTINVDEVGVTNEWKKLVGLEGKDGLLVRPDQHVLGRVTSTEDVQILLKNYM